MRRPRTALATLLALSLTAALALGSTPAGAISKTQRPTWWSKYRYLTSHPALLTQSGSALRSATAPTVGPNVDVSNEKYPQSETSIAIDPSSPSHLVAGSNEIYRLPMRSYHSSDSGASWSGVDLPLPPPIRKNGYDYGSDPSVAWDRHGNVYYSYIIVFFGAGYGVVGSEMAVARSSDDGKTWKATYFDFQTNEGTFVDKPMITVDNSSTSPREGTIYVAFDHTGGNKRNAVFVASSTDGGRSFSAPKQASQVTNGNNGGIGANPYVSPNGDVHVAWQDWVDSAVETSTSTDGGATWGRTVIIQPTAAAFELALPSISSRAALLSPSCDTDISSGPYRGTLYCSWFDGSISQGTDVLVSSSSDDGATWSEPLQVNHISTGDQYYQWLAVDPVTGDVDISWYDTRLDPSRRAVNVYFAFSSNGGASFSPNIRVSTASSNEEHGAKIDRGNQYGDYEGLDAYGGVAHPVWTDNRSSLDPSLWEEVFTATVTVGQ
ncbi:MAG: hypothetical protein QOG88_1151 [Actinomycetota bacterium]|nr:hypothetical protein [Actinomycetota bacterium]